MGIFSEEVFQIADHGFITGMTRLWGVGGGLHPPFQAFQVELLGVAENMGAVDGGEKKADSWAGPTLR